MTEQAASMIRELLDQSELPDGAGLRIAQRDDHSALGMALTEQPSYHDLVLLEHDVAVFVGPAALQRIRGRTLDARRGETGAAFYVRD